MKRLICFSGKSLFQPLKAALALGSIEDSIRYLKTSFYKGKEIELIEKFKRSFDLDEIIVIHGKDWREEFIAKVLKEYYSSEIKVTLRELEEYSEESIYKVFDKISNGIVAICSEEPYSVIISYVAGILSYPVAINLKDGIKILQKRR